MSDEILRCPCKEKRPLVEKDGDLACAGADCPHSQAPHLFRRFGGKPILIAFEKTDTLCTPSAYETGKFYFPRKATKFMEFARGLFYGVSQRTLVNCARFVDMVKQKNPGPRVLVIGSGSKGSGTERLWDDEAIRKTGVDIYFSPSVDYIADAHFLPFADASFDGVWIQAVLEHVAAPADVVAEIARVLKPEGVVYAETPFMQQVHEGAYDFTRYTVTGHRFLFRDFSLVHMGGNGGPAFVLAWSVKYLVWGLTRSKKAGVAAGLPFFLLARLLDRFVGEPAMWDGPSGVFFLGVKNTEHPARARDLPALYQGFQR